MASNAELFEALTDIQVGNPVSRKTLGELLKKGLVDKDGGVTERGMRWAEREAERQIFGTVRRAEVRGRRINDPRVTGFKNEFVTPGLSDRAPGGAKNPVTVEDVSKGRGPETIGQNPYWATTRINPETGEPYTLPRVERRLAASNIRRLALQREAAKRGARITGITGRNSPIPGYTERTDQPTIRDLKGGEMDPERVRRIGDQLDRQAWREVRAIEDEIWGENQRLMSSGTAPRTSYNPPRTSAGSGRVAATSGGAASGGAGGLPKAPFPIPRPAPVSTLTPAPTPAPAPLSAVLPVTPATSTIPATPVPPVPPVAQQLRLFELPAPPPSRMLPVLARPSAATFAAPSVSSVSQPSLPLSLRSAASIPPTSPTPPAPPSLLAPPAPPSPPTPPVSLPESLSPRPLALPSSPRPLALPPPRPLALPPGGAGGAGGVAGGAGGAGGAAGWAFATEMARQGMGRSAAANPSAGSAAPPPPPTPPTPPGGAGRFFSRGPSALFQGGLRGTGPMMIRSLGAALPGMAVNYAGGRVASGAEDVEGRVDRADVGQFLQGLGSAGTIAVPLGLVLGATPLGWAGLGLAAAGWGIWNAIRGRGDSFEEKIDKAFSAAVDAGLPPEEEASWRAEIELNRAMGMSDDQILAGLQESLPRAVAEFREQSRMSLPPEQLLAFQKAWADIANQISQQEMAYINSAYETYLQEAARMGYTPSPSTRMALELGKMAAARDAAGRQWQMASFPFDEYTAYQNQLRDSVVSALNRRNMAAAGLGGGSLPALSLDQLSQLSMSGG